MDLNKFGVPASLEEALRYDDLAGSRSIESHATGRAASRLQTHSQAAGRTGKHVWHGHGSKATEIKEQVARFLHLVEEGVSKALAGSDTPLIVAAVSSEAEMYRNLADVHHPVEGIVEGNPDLLTDDQLADIGRPAAQELLRGRLEERLEAYTTAIGSGKASTDPREIVTAARAGGVDTLFVEKDARLWGDLNDLSPTRSTPQRGDEELIDAMARYTLTNGGEAFQVEAGDMPERANAAAIFRY